MKPFSSPGREQSQAMLPLLMGVLLEGFPRVVEVGAWKTKPWECREGALGFMGGDTGRKGALLGVEGGSQWIS